MLHNNHIGDVRTTSIDTVVYQQQLAANRSTPCAYKGRDDLNAHIPKWTYPLIVDSDYERFADWHQRCFEHGHYTVDVVSPTTGISRRIKV
jgi:hypothetical protein